jgi:hypothetical protein
MTKRSSEVQVTASIYIHIPERSSKHFMASMILFKLTDVEYLTTGFCG